MIQERVEHDGGVSEDDDQLSKGEAGRDAKVEHVRERRVHDRRPARYTRRRAVGCGYMSAREAGAGERGNDEGRGGGRARRGFPVASAAAAAAAASTVPRLVDGGAHGLVRARADRAHRLGASGRAGTTERIALLGRVQCAGAEEEPVEEFGGLEKVDERAWDGEDDIESEKGKQDDVDVKDESEGVKAVRGSGSKRVCARHGGGGNGRTKCDSLATGERGEAYKEDCVSHDGTT